MSTHALACTKPRETPGLRASTPWQHQPRHTSLEVNRSGATLSPPALYSATRTECRTKLTGHPQGSEQPNPKSNILRWPTQWDNPEKTTKLENGIPLPTTGQKPRPQEQHNDHSITVLKTNKNTNRQSAGMKNIHTKWTRSIQLKPEAYRVNVGIFDPWQFST